MKWTLIMLGAFALGFWVARSGSNTAAEIATEETVTPTAKTSGASTAAIPNNAVAQRQPTSWLESEYGGSWARFIDHLVTLAPKTAAYSAAWQRIHALPFSDQRALLQSALAYGKRGQVKELISNLIYTLAKEDMPQARVMFEEMSSIDRAHFGTTFLYGWARGDSKGVWDWLNKVDRESTGSFLRTDTILQIKRAAITGMMNDPHNSVDVLKLALSEPDIVFAEQALDTVVSHLVEKDAAGTLELIDSYPQIADTIVEKTIAHWTRTDLPQAVAFLVTNEDIASVESAAIVGTALLLNSDPESLPQLYDELERPALKEQIASITAGNLAQENLAEAIQWIDTIETERTKRRAASGVIHKLGFNGNMDTHIQFLETTLGTSAEARPVYVHSLREWQKVHPDRVHDYVHSLPPEASDLRDQLIWQLNLRPDEEGE